MDATTEVIAVEREIAIAASPRDGMGVPHRPEEGSSLDGYSRPTFEVYDRVGSTASTWFRAISRSGSSSRSTRRSASSTRGGGRADREARVPPGSTKVEFDLIEGDRGGTLLRFRHSELPSRRVGRVSRPRLGSLLRATGRGGDGRGSRARPVGLGSHRNRCRTQRNCARPYHAALTRQDFERRADRAEDVRRACVSHRRQHGRWRERPGWAAGPRRPGRVGAALVTSTNASLMEMRGRQMQGWLRVGPEARANQGASSRKWVELGVTFARSLPAKTVALAALSAWLPARARH